MLVSTVATHPRIADIEAALAARTPLRTIARDFGLSKTAIVRHQRAKRPKPDRRASLTGPNEEPDQDQREAELLVRAARRHLKQALKSAEDKDRNGAITAAIKALEHRAKLRGKLQSGTRIDIQQSQVTGLAVEQHQLAQQMAPQAILAQAGSVIGDGVLRSDPVAMRMVADLYALVQAQVSQPSTSQATVEE